VALEGVIIMLVNYSLLGVVYARFSRPAKRAGTLKFSKHMVLYEVRQAGPMQERLGQGVLVGLVVGVGEARPAESEVDGDLGKELFDFSLPASITTLEASTYPHCFIGCP
jgi:hypothetical protein